MDWSKAKTILIVAFLVTNILLGSVLFLNGRDENDITKDSFIEDVTKLLENKDVFIDAEIPREIPSLNNLTVEYEILDLYEINKKYFNGEGRIESIESNNKRIVYGDEEVLIERRKKIIYTNNSNEELFQELNEEYAKIIALEFLTNRGYDTGDMKLYHVVNIGNIYKLQFSKMYKERYLESADTIVEVDKRGVKRLERLWLNALEEGEKPIYISTAAKSILSLSGMVEAKGRTIKDISLCYYFNPVDQEYIMATKDAKKGKAGPAWRILFDDGSKVIIDNYNR